MPVTREAIDGMFKTLNAADRAIVSETSDNYYGADVADLIGDRLSITTTELRDALAYALIRGGLRPHLPPPDRDPGC